MIKLGRRKHDQKAMKRALLRYRSCYCGQLSTDPHHVLFRSDGGDDVVQNILPLCHDDHRAYHVLTGDDGRDQRRRVGQALRPETVAYILDKLGEHDGLYYLSRRYELREQESLAKKEAAR